MLRIIHSVSSKHAKSYYSEGVTREGYYAEGQEMAGLWGGKAALKLGLLGRVEQRAFALLCDNLNPSTGEPLTPRNMARLVSSSVAGAKVCQLRFTDLRRVAHPSQTDSQNIGQSGALARDQHGVFDDRIDLGNFGG